MTGHLHFGELHDELLRDRIVVSIKHKNLSDKSQIDPELTLKKAVDLVRQREVMKRQQITLNNVTTALDIDGAVVPESQRDERNTKECQRCGRLHATTGKRPALGAKCFRCSGVRHFARCCFTGRVSEKPRRKEVNVVNMTAFDEEEVSYLGEVASTNVSN